MTMTQTAQSVGAAPDMPTQRGDRVVALDVLRGFAVMAIFVVNIKAMVQPFGFMFNVTVWPGEYDKLIATIQMFLVDDKWRTIFTGLFGAGLVLIAEKTASRGGDPTARLRTRLIWLLVFGLIHLIGIWIGDILTLYALVGLVAMVFWRKSPRVLWIYAFWVGLAGLVMLALFLAGMGLAASVAPPEDAVELSAELWGTDPGFNQQQVDLALGPFWGPILQRAWMGPLNTIGAAVFAGYGAITLANMLAGMALWKTGFLRGDWSARAYAMIAVVALAVAYGLDAARFWTLEATDWAFETFAFTAGPNVINGFAGALGYSALILWLIKLGAKFSPVAAVGRMAFTNYIACSLIGTTIGVGHGFGLFGSMTLLQAMGVVGATWLAMLIWSPIWLSAFQFGPLEWLWRSLTYGRRAPFLHS